MKKIIQSFLTLFFILICIETKAQSYSSDPEKFITEIINEAKEILSSQDSQELKAEKLKAEKEKAKIEKLKKEREKLKAEVAELEKGRN